MAYIKNTKQAISYAKFRPSPPPELIDRIIKFLTEEFQEKDDLKIALDVGCGSGQSTNTLAPYFKQVIGIDNSEDQLKQVQENNNMPNITYRLGSAEDLGEPNNSVALVTVGMALHWFDLQKFSNEVSRVLQRNGVLAAYGYNLPYPAIGNNSHASFWKSILMDKIDAYCPEESKTAYFDSYNAPQYCQFSFSKSPTQRYKFETRSKAQIADLLGYVSSMSAYQNYMKDRGEKETQTLMKYLQSRLMDHLGFSTGFEEIDLVFPYFLLLSRKEI